MGKEKSEFGKGLVICLVKFAEHFENGMITTAGFIARALKKSKEDQALIMSDHPPDRLNYGKNSNQSFKSFMKSSVPIWGSEEKALSQELTLWANGASDHLYEIQIPKGKTGKLVEQLKEKGLDMGHGFRSDKFYTLDDIAELKKLTRDIALLIDKDLGLKPDIGQW